MDGKRETPVAVFGLDDVTADHDCGGNVEIHAYQINSSFAEVTAPAVYLTPVQVECRELTHCLHLVDQCRGLDTLLVGVIRLIVKH